ncbi:hypothetical protein J4417_03895 [Candidatus Woesearchaeota archaeon]|nr:hypothetical protein [Candidatus Woesearchaeota archaeon]
MKPNQQELMDKLEIDAGLRETISQLWEHDYETFDSCEGHGRHPAYIVLSKGDGWFEQNAESYGLERCINEINCSGCEGRVSHPERPAEKKCCKICGSGINEFTVYRGTGRSILSF